ncbi:alpha/beta fold hydrolase [Kordiimonas marina]|uniref:alpha/beta fold hydrolase n=1 Tax=Kordiimonas marina TaxID=2872312 RepID=UPI001FF124F9|nr:alpha/beta hydrolase [Kordiimonas marina]MCJ9428481.1 alpha/beta hydrolase [Kordiimonas marina]
MDKAPIAFDQWQKCGKYFEWNNHHVFFQRGGKGDVMLTLHGFPTSGWDWVWVSRALVEHFHMVVPDLLDYGSSLNGLKRACTIMDQADMLEALMAHRGIKQVHLLAHDVGDTVAQELLARQNENRLSFQIKSVVFLNGGMIPSLHKPRRVQTLLAGPFGPLFARLAPKKKMLQGLAGVFGPDTRPQGADLEGFWPTMVGVNGRGAFSRRIRYMAERRKYADRWVNALRDAHLPMMLINGTADPVSGGHAADGFAEVVPKAKLARLPGIGHFPQVEAPEAVMELILRFHDCIIKKTIGKSAPNEGQTATA